MAARCSHPQHQRYANGRCRLCAQAAHQRWAAKNPGAERAKGRRHILDVPPEPAAGAACDLCGQPMNETPHADHDHATRRFRGWTHKSCNNLLGAAQDDPARLLAALDYLKRTTGQD